MQPLHQASSSSAAQPSVAGQARRAAGCNKALARTPLSRAKMLRGPVGFRLWTDRPILGANIPETWILGPCESSPALQEIIK